MNFRVKGFWVETETRILKRNKLLKIPGKMSQISNNFISKI